MPKLLYITNQICGPGGLERVLSIKASYLADTLGYDVHILTLNQNKQDLFYTFSEKLQYHDVTAIGNPISYFYKYISGIKKVVKTVSPDIILVCDDGLKGLFLPLLLGKPCPMIYERHVSKNIELQNENASFFNKMIAKVKFKLMDLGAFMFDRFIVLTKGNQNEWRIQNMEVIPNPLSFYPKEDNLSKLSNKKVLAVGKQSYQKGYDRLLKSWKQVVQNHPEWHLDIYGTIDKNQKLDLLANTLEITANVHFHQPKKNIAEAYQEASIYVMSSRYEGFGMVLTEAMSYGVPCISFDCPYGPSDIIKQQEDGLLIENGNIDGLAQAITTLIDNDQTRMQMGRKARANVKRYDITSIALQWDHLFKTLLS